ncbi:SpoIIAA family protein [Geomesophilobacter sediminis]|uniref:STAS/SEC14 domain-containing protein n=1 Tax=Geomesophilobacter sediminis TaxID=2798584 RepID=A0A8J7M1C6_9BACT|nr:STAS/SEC14 domain-containing protein [Geomesophilobacter sediminis]MBJ6726829.1 STAS/SEC14 domain-containing protein [Geomesophilobacter sediminis]
MVERIEGLPEHVLGFNARGQVTAADYETIIIPAVEEMRLRHRRLHFLYHLGPEFTGFEAKALWDDARLGIAHRKEWERIAVVTDLTWVHNVIAAFGFTMTGDTRIYGNELYQEAVDWVAEGER